MKKKSLLIICLVMVLVLSLVGACAKPAPAPAPAPAPPPAPAPAPVPAPAPAPVPEPERFITIGVSTPLSGFAAAWGIYNLRAAELVFEKINAAGGITIEGKKHKIEWVVYDDKYDATEGAIIASRLIYQDKVDIFTVYSGGAATAARKVSHEAGMLQFGTSFALDEPSPEYPYAFTRLMRYPELVTAGIPWLAKNHPQVKKLAKIGPNSPYGKASEKVGKGSALAVGLEVVATELFEPGTADFTALLLSILAAEPDVIDCTASPTDATATIVKQARELGYEGLFCHWSGIGLATAIKLAGADAMEGFIAGSDYGEPFSAEQQEIVDAYLKKYGPPFETSTLEAYPGWQAFMQAVELAGSLERDAIANAMRTGRFQTIAGEAHWGGKEHYGVDNQILYRMFMTTAKGGKSVFLDTAEPGAYPEK